MTYKQKKNSLASLESHRCTPKWSSSESRFLPLLGEILSLSASSDVPFFLCRTDPAAGLSEAPIQSREGQLFKILTAMRCLPLRFLAIWGPVLKAKRHLLVDLGVLWTRTLVVMVECCNTISVLLSRLFRKKVGFHYLPRFSLPTLISKDLEMIGPSNPQALQSATNLSLLDKILFVSLLLKHLYLSAEVASHLLWHMSSGCFSCSLFSSVHSACMADVAPPWQTGCWERELGRQPKNCFRKLGCYVSNLKRFVPSRRRCIWGFSVFCS